MRTFGLTAVAALALAACDSNDAGNNLSTDTNLGADGAVLGANEATDNEAAVAMPTDANGFATAVAASDLYEIESGRLAQQKGSSADVKSMAEHLVTDHQKSTADLKAAAAKASPAVTVAPALDAEKQAMLDELKAASGADFDRKFLDQQTTAHQKALALLRNYASGGDSQPLKDFASKAATAVDGHLEHLNSIKK